LIHEHQVDAAVALTAACHELGDRVAVYGFHSWGRANVHLRRVKAFDYASNTAVAERFGGLESVAYTRLGAAIRHGAWLLRQEAGTAHHLLFVLSDGFAYDDGYEGRYGQADAAKALDEVRSAGVGAACLSLGSTTGVEELRRVFGRACHLMAPTWSDAQSQVGSLCRAALDVADRRRSLTESRPAWDTTR
jgi:nitric oxide reductase activation protein